MAALFLLGICFISLWFSKEIKYWGSLFALSLIFGIYEGFITWIGLLPIFILTLLWIGEVKFRHWLFFLGIVVLSTLFKLHVLPGFSSYFFTPKFTLGFESPLIGLFPLALLVPLSKSREEWIEVLKGLGLGILGIIGIAVTAMLIGAIKIDLNLPSHYELRLLANLIFTCIPEEGFYRGYVQNRLTSYLGNWGALFLTSALFTATHLLWSSSPAILAFAFIASLLYGVVYLYSRRIESAILTHFLLNWVHITFFYYAN